MKKRYFFLITLIGFACLFIVPFFFYWLSMFFYFIGGLIDLYQSFLLNYFDEVSVLIVSYLSLIFCIAIIGSAICFIIEESKNERK